MNQTLDDKISIIRESVKAGNAHFMEVSGSFRVDFESGLFVYIYVETYDNSITVRFETKETDPGRRGHELETLHALLDREICFADISDFQEAGAYRDRFVFTADVRLDESVFFHETVVMGPDIPVINENLSAAAGNKSFNKEPGAPAENKDALSPAEKAVRQLETIDAKMLRQSLDMMNLKRSSNVRLALTRIFRSSGDPGELMLSIRDEAAKIVSRKDHEDLRMIKMINADGFLEPVIGLLCETVFGKDLSS